MDRGWQYSDEINKFKQVARTQGERTSSFSSIARTKVLEYVDYNHMISNALDMIP